jgi:hypothetical protein
MSATLSAPDESAALELLHELGCTDGLPVVVPTPERVERMALAMGLDPELSLGAMGPNLGDCTVEKVAACAVMAGCLPDHAPVVLAAVRAALDPAFDLTELQATTHAISPFVLVNGPARHACGPIASGFGALGPGHRANASIGRALRLAMINIGGGRPGISDMALLGHPGKFTMCLAEDEEASPWEPLHVARGYVASDSVVTLVGTEGPHSVIFVGDADDPSAPDRLLDTLAASLATVGSNNAHFGRGTVVVLLNPDHTAVLATAGLGRADVATALWERAVNPRERMHGLNPSMIPAGEPGSPWRALRSPDDVLVVAAGGSGLYSMVVPSWGAGPHANPAVSALVELDQACAVPFAAAVTARA